MIEQLGLVDMKPFSTPGHDDIENERDGGVELVGEQAALFRGIAARLNYLSMDRPDIMFAAKEACRLMAKPLGSSLRRLHRIWRYLKGGPRLTKSCHGCSARCRMRLLLYILFDHDQD